MAHMPCWKWTAQAMTFYPRTANELPSRVVSEFKTFLKTLVKKD